MGHLPGTQAARAGCLLRMVAKPAVARPGNGRFRGDLAIPSRAHWDGIFADGTLGPLPWDRPHRRSGDAEHVPLGFLTNVSRVSDVGARSSLRPVHGCRQRGDRADDGL